MPETSLYGKDLAAKRCLNAKSRISPSVARQEMALVSGLGVVRHLVTASFSVAVG